MGPIHPVWPLLLYVISIEFSALNQALEAAAKALEALDKRDFANIKSYAAPPVPVTH